MLDILLFWDRLLAERDEVAKNLEPILYLPFLFGRGIRTGSFVIC